MAWEHWKPGPNGKLIQVTDEVFQQPVPQPSTPPQPENYEIRGLQTIVGQPTSSPSFNQLYETYLVRDEKGYPQTRYRRRC